MVLSPLTDRHESGRPLRRLALPASRLTRHRMTARVRPARAAGCSLHGPPVTVPGGQAPKTTRSPHAAGAGSVSDSHQTGDRCEYWGKEGENGALPHRRGAGLASHVSVGGAEVGMAARVWRTPSLGPRPSGGSRGAAGSSPRVSRDSRTVKSLPLLPEPRPSQWGHADARDCRAGLLDDSTPQASEGPTRGT